MTILFFLQGLIVFTTGLVVLVENQHRSRIALSYHLAWLSAFGFLSSLWFWGRMLQTIRPGGLTYELASLVILIVMPLAGIVLVRFGIGLFAQLGSLPTWLHMTSLVMVVPIALAVAHTVAVLLNGTQVDIAVNEWSRLLLFAPGSLLTALGFFQQWRRLRTHAVEPTYNLLLGAAVAFTIFGVLALFYPTTVVTFSAEAARLISLGLVGFFVVTAMRVFEIERQQIIETLELERIEAHHTAASIRAESRQRAEVWLDGLVRISRQIASMDHIEQVMHDSLEIARSFMQADIAVLALRDSSTTLAMKYRVPSNGSTASAASVATCPALLTCVDENRPLRVPEDTGDIGLMRQADDSSQRLDRAALVPLHLDNTVIGVLCVGREVAESFTCTDLIGLGHLANQIVIALEHASMASRLQSLAVIEERSRIAREMHDSLAQILGYLGLETQTLAALVRQGDSEAVLTQLKQAQQTIKSAQADVRQNILSLRTTLSFDAGLVTSLEEYITEFGIQTGIRIELHNELRTEPTLSPLAAAQLARIVQEALANVRKHASAGQVQVTLLKQAHALKVVICDNGIGFNKQQVPSSHFGLQTMHERAESVGGQFKLTSTPQKGTRIDLLLPLI